MIGDNHNPPLGRDTLTLAIAYGKTEIKVLQHLLNKTRTLKVWVLRAKRLELTFMQKTAQYHADGATQPGFIVKCREIC